jgi:hypothetical protein
LFVVVLSLSLSRCYCLSLSLSLSLLLSLFCAVLLIGCECGAVGRCRLVFVDLIRSLSLFSLSLSLAVALWLSLPLSPFHFSIPFCPTPKLLLSLRLCVKKRAILVCAKVEERKDGEEEEEKKKPFLSLSLSLSLSLPSLIKTRGLFFSILFSVSSSNLRGARLRADSGLGSRRGGSGHGRGPLPRRVPLPVEIPQREERDAGARGADNEDVAPAFR